MWKQPPQYMERQLPLGEQHCILQGSCAQEPLARGFRTGQAEETFMVPYHLP